MGMAERGHKAGAALGRRSWTCAAVLFDCRTIVGSLIRACGGDHNQYGEYIPIGRSPIEDIAVRAGTRSTWSAHDRPRPKGD
jgi:hypothetical protein